MTVPYTAKLAALQAYFGSGTFNWYLVTAAVNPATASTVANLTQVSGGTYALQPLTGVTVAQDGAAAKVTCSNPTYSGFYAGSATAIVGGVIAKQAGGSPASSDQLVRYIPLRATVTQTINTTSGSQLITAASGLTSYAEGDLITGTGIPTGTEIREILSGTQAFISREATATNTGITATIYVANTLTPPTTVGSAINTLTINLGAEGFWGIA